MRSGGPGKLVAGQVVGSVDGVGRHSASTAWGRFSYKLRDLKAKKRKKKREVDVLGYNCTSSNLPALINSR